MAEKRKPEKRLSRILDELPADYDRAAFSSFAALATRYPRVAEAVAGDAAWRAKDPDEWTRSCAADYLSRRRPKAKAGG